MTQKRYTEIPKRQKCINKEEPYIGGAKDIIDDELEQPQEVINSAIEHPYNAQSPNGMGRIVLKKNKSFASQVTQANTIYVIQYDFTLTGDVTIPANCVLQFDGGSISGAYTLTGNNTGIDAGLVKILSIGVTIAGTWNVAEAYPEWFGAIGDNITNDSLAIQKTLDSFMCVYFASKTYKIESPLIIRRDNKINGGGIIDNVISNRNEPLNGATFILKSTHISIENIKLSGNNNNYGIVFDLIDTINPSNNIKLSNIKLFNFYYSFYDYTSSFMITMMRIHCVSCDNAFFFGNNKAHTSLTFIDCWAENCGSAYTITSTTYSTLMNCGADMCNNNTPTNPYGQGYGDTGTNKGVYHIEGCNNISIINCGTEGCYGNGAVYCNSSIITINGLTSYGLKSTYAPDYNSNPYYCIGVIVFGSDPCSANITNIVADSFVNTYVNENYPNKPKGFIAINYAVGAYGQRSIYDIIIGTISQATGLSNVNGYYTAHCLQVTETKKTISLSESLVLGNNYRKYSSKRLNSSNNCTKIVIPFGSQENDWYNHCVKVTAIPIIGNQEAPIYDLDIACTSLTVVSQVVVRKTNVDGVTANASGLNLVINLPTSFTSICLFVEILGNDVSLLNNDDISIE